MLRGPVRFTHMGKGRPMKRINYSRRGEQQERPTARDLLLPANLAELTECLDVGCQEDSVSRSLNDVTPR
ncbi:Hypothetical predicted protein [Cloeon dipterum]|uniref:Uncharacterized protein n=1 Tax=Cloeon dipterum TaxID=197152 RepID=A0A8S1EC70_9INSE|nr:Hypothetical predicted protein [Cloeon dipterum]